jgi:hypothetical protein
MAYKGCSCEDSACDTCGAQEPLAVLQELVDWQKAKIERPSLCGAGHADYLDTIIAKALRSLQAYA